MRKHKGFSKQLVLYLSETEGQILDELIRRHGTEDPGLTQLEMNDLLDKGKSTISEAVTFLEDNDLVEKQSRDSHPDLVVLKNPDVFPSA